MGKRGFDEALLFYRAARNLTQTEMAELLGLSFRYYQKLESGKSEPSLTSLNKVLLGLNVSFDEFFQASIRSREPDRPDPVYERLISAENSVERPTDFVHLLDLFLDSPANIRAVVLALLASDQRIAESHYSDFAARRARLLKSP